MNYRGKAAVDGIDLDLRRGEVFALLGPNGAGKTTTVEILEGYRSRDAGEVEVLGADPGTAGLDFPSRRSSLRAAGTPWLTDSISVLISSRPRVWSGSR